MTASASRRSTHRSLCVLCAATLASSVGCVGAPKILPPRTPPDAVPPPVALPSSPPENNRGRVVLFTTDGPMRVVAEAPKQFAATGAEPPRSGELCVSPCVVDIPPGHYKLYLEGVQPGGPTGDVDDLQVNPGLNYYLRAPGKFDQPTWIPWGPTLIAIAGGLVATSGVLWAASSANGGSATPGLVVFGAGLGILIGAGVYTYDAQRGTIQQGATTQWSVPLR
jgi:hypothetical protein